MRAGLGDGAMLHFETDLWLSNRALEMSKGLQVLLLVVASAIFAPCGLAQSRDIVWTWNSACPNPTYVTLRVELDGKTIYVKRIPLCRWERRFEDGKASFQFRPRRELIWYGYRSDKGDPSPADTPLTVDFWEAGGDPGEVLLGYSVASANRVYMNSIYMLWPERKGSLVMAPGLVLMSIPSGNGG